MRRFLTVFALAALCGLSVYAGGWVTRRLLLALLDNPDSAGLSPVWGFVFFVPGALLGALAARWVIRRRNIDIERLLLGAHSGNGGTEATHSDDAIPDGTRFFHDDLKGLVADHPTPYSGERELSTGHCEYRAEGGEWLLEFRHPRTGETGMRWTPETHARAAEMYRRSRAAKGGDS